MRLAVALRRHARTLLWLGVLVWLAQAVALYGLARAPLPDPALLAAQALGDLCLSHGGDAPPTQNNHSCCLACVGVGSAGAPPLPAIAVPPAPTLAHLTPRLDATVSSYVWRQPPERAPPRA